jgi:hypothetical protein
MLLAVWKRCWRENRLDQSHRPTSACCPSQPRTRGAESSLPPARKPQFVARCAATLHIRFRFHRLAHALPHNPRFSMPTLNWRRRLLGQPDQIEKREIGALWARWAGENLHFFMPKQRDFSSICTALAARQ